MAHSNKKDDIPFQIRDNYPFSLDILGSSQRLIPVQLPERPVSTSGVQSTLAPPTLINLDDTISGFNIRRAHSSSPGAYSRRTRIEACPPSPGSPLSELSRHSEESILIVGDTFSAPTRLRISLESAAHFTNAGAIDSLQRSLSQTSLPTASQLTGSSLNPSQNDLPLSMPSSPNKQNRLSPKSARHQSVMTSRLVPDLPIQPTPKNPIESPVFLRSSPPGESPSTSQTKRKSSRSRRRKRRGSTLSSSELPSSAGNSFGPHSEGTDTPGANQDPTISDYHGYTFKELENNHGLNPYAAAFEPINVSRLSIPLPIQNLPHFSNEPLHRTNPTQPVSGYAGLMFHPFHQQTIANIQQDLPHLRQWSNLFQHYERPVNHFHHHQLQDGYVQERFAGMNMGLSNEREPFPMPGAPVGYSFVAANHSSQSHPGVFHRFAPPSYLASPSYHSVYTSTDVGENNTRTPLPIPIIAPKPSFHSSGFSSAPVLNNLDPHRDANYSIGDNPSVALQMPIPIISEDSTETEEREKSKAKLVERGKSSLTPVTERSEVSTTPKYASHEDFSNLASELVSDTQSTTKKRKKKHGRRSRRKEPTLPSGKESPADDAVKED